MIFFGQVGRAAQQQVAASVVFTTVSNLVAEPDSHQDQGHIW